MKVCLLVVGIEAILVSVFLWCAELGDWHCAGGEL